MWLEHNWVSKTTQSHHIGCIESERASDAMGYEM